MYGGPLVSRLSSPGRVPAGGAFIIISDVPWNVKKLAGKYSEETLGKGAINGRGLGKSLQGRLHPIAVLGKKDQFGLGFKPNFEQRKKEYN